MEKLINQIVEWLVTCLISLCPAALGATVGMLFEKGLTWADRCYRLFVGITVNFFVSRAIDAIWPVDPAVSQAIAFVIGVTAFAAMPPFIAAMVEVVAGLPAAVRDRIFPKGAGK